MTVAVVGLGAVGGLLAGVLQRSGHRVLALTSPQRRAALAERGYVVHSPRFGDFHARPQVSEKLRTGCDAIFICVKSYQLDAALADVEADRIGTATVVPLLNGLEHMATLRRVFEPSQVLAGSIGKIEVKRLEFDQVEHSNAGAWVGLAGPASGPIAGMLREAGFEVELFENEARLLWHKLVRLAPLACLTAASGLSLGQLRQSEPWASRLQHAVRETVAVAKAHGVGLSADETLAVIAGLPGHISTSTARDVQAGRASELDAIAGAVLRAGKSVGMECPTLASTMEAIVAMQETG